MDPREEIIFRLRAATDPWREHIVEKRMFGGTAFLYKGKMSIGEMKGNLMVRVIPERMEETLTHSAVAHMKFTGKAMKEFIEVSSDGFKNEEELQHWVELGIEHAISKTK